MKDTIAYRGSEDGQVARVDPGSPAEAHYKKLGWKPAADLEAEKVKAATDLLNPAASRTEISPPPPEAAEAAAQNKIDPAPVTSGTSHATLRHDDRKGHGKG